MAERFNLTAQIQLQAPTNTAQVVGQIKKQLKGVSVDIKVKSNASQVAKLNKELQGVSKSSDASAKSIGRMNSSIAQSARRFSVITVATGSFLALARAVKNATGEAISFEREVVKISQVTGNTVKSLQSLTKEVTRLSTSLGASSSELLNVSRILAQAGFSALKTKQALEVLAQTTLAATFDNIQDTTEGAIAVLRQFSDEARRAGGEIKFLTSTLDAINSVSKSFAVESGDLITAIRRVGGVFAATGGSVNELIALFTSVRATTRESAETIATGLRTIFTRLQRTDTVDQLKELGIELRNSQGQFVGAYEAVRRLSAGLSQLDPRDARFSDIVEELGGFRQVGKVIPLIQQFATAQNALAVAQNSAGSVARDAATAQLALGVQIIKVKEEFAGLIRQFTQSDAFQDIAGGALQLASAFIKVAASLENVLPLILQLMALKIGQSLAPGLGALVRGSFAARGKNQGGKIHAFARGGYVPGTGSRDTVPAMLQPGEFVIKKSSAAKLGAPTLEAMNNNRFAKGGKLQAAKLNRIVDGDSLNISATPAGEPFNTSSRLIGYDAYELRGGKKWENALGAIATKMAQQEYGTKKSVFKYFKDHGKDKFGRPMYQDDAFGQKMLAAGVATRYSGSGQGATGSGKATETQLQTLQKYGYGPRGGQPKKTPKKKAMGGGISGSDTVPALLTPGEYVINKSAAQGIGYSNLNKMNQTGVRRFAAGGPVGVQRFSIGGGVGPGGGDNSRLIITAIDRLTSVLQSEATVISSHIKVLSDALQALKGTNSASGDPKNPDVVSTAVNEGFAELSSDTMALGQVMEAVNDSVRDNNAELRNIAQILSQSTGVKPSEFEYEAMDSTGLETSGTVEAYSSGQVEEMMRSQGFYVTKLNELSQDSAEMSNSLNSSSKTHDTLIKSLLEEIEATKESTEAKDDVAKSSKKLNKAQLAAAKKTHEIQKQIRGGHKSEIRAGGGGGGPSVPGGGGGRASENLAGTMNQVSGALNGLATAAIGATFIIGGLIESSGNLTDSQKKSAQAAANAFSARIALLAQIGSLALQVGAAIVTTVGNTAAKKAEAIASYAVIKAKMQEAGVQMGGKNPLKGLKAPVTNVGRAMSGLAGLVGSAAGAFAMYSIITSVLAAETAYAVQELQNFADKMKEVADKELEKIGSPTETASETKFVAAQQGQVSAEINQNIEKSVGAFNNSLVKYSAIAATALTSIAGAAAYTALGLQVVPVAGQVAGFALAAFAATAVIAAGVLSYFGKSAREEAEKMKAVFEPALRASKGFAEVTFRSRKAVADFDETMQEAKDANLDATGTLRELAGASSSMVSTFRESSDKLRKASADRREATKAAAEAGLLTEGGNIKELGPDATDEQIDRVEFLKSLIKQEEQAHSEYNNMLGKMTAQEANIRNQITASLNETIAEINEIDTTALSGFTGNMSELRQLATQQNAAGKAAREMVTSIDAANQAFEDIVEGEYATRIESVLKDTKGGSPGTVQAGKDVAAALGEERDKKIAQFQAQQTKELADSAVKIHEDTKARILNTMALREQERVINESNNVIRAFNDVLLGGTKTAQNFAQIQDATSVRAGSGGQFSAIQIDSSALDVPFAQIGEETLRLATGLSSIKLPGSGTVFDASPIAKRLEDAKKVAAAIPDAFRGVTTGLDRTLPEAVDEVVANIEQATGIQNFEGTDIGKRLREQIEASFKDSKGQAISPADYKPILDEIADLAAPSAEALKKAVEVQNVYLSKMSQINQSLIDAQQKLADATANVTDVQARAADRLAQATGGKRSTRSRQRDRLRAAQERLGPTATAAGARAGDVAGTLGAAQRLTAEANEKRRAQQEVALTGASTDRITGAQYTTANLEELGKAANSASAGAAKAKAELERMADQSALAGDVMAQIAEEQKGRKQLKAAGERFAFGSDEQRKQMNTGIKDMQNAIINAQQGRGLAGATEEQRASVLSTLDQFADVDINVGGGQTAKGREIKAEIQRQELLRQGVDPRIAQASFDQALKGSKEEQLLGQLAAIGEQEKNAALALREFAEKEVNYLGQIAENTRNQFSTDLINALSQNQPTPQQQKDQAKDDATLKSQLDETEANLAQSIENQTKATEALEQAVKDLQIARDDRKDAQKDLTDATNRDQEIKTQRIDAANAYIGRIQGGDPRDTGLGFNSLGRDQEVSTSDIAIAGLAPVAAPIIQVGAAVGEMRANQPIPGKATQGVFPGYDPETGKKLPLGQANWHGGPIYRNEGGGIFQSQGSDTVPAMLTPGEFVMRKSAVDKVGVGYMRQLNRGHIPGFRRGGFIGTGGVQYRQNGGQIGDGGGLMVDPSNLAQVLSEFDISFRGGLDATVKELQGISQSFTSLSESFKNINMTHTFTGDMTLAFNITNKDALAKAVSDATSDTMKGLIQQAVDQAVIKIKDGPAT
jgi:TP901 family phage tail tape measure protein